MALKVLDQALQTCALCSTPQVKPYQKNAWEYLLKKHSEDDKFLETAIQKAKAWKASLKRQILKNNEFIESVLMPGLTSVEVQDLIKEFLVVKYTLFSALMQQLRFNADPTLTLSPK